MGRANNAGKLSREEIIEKLKSELEKETNAMLDKMAKVDNAYDFESIAVKGFSSFNQKWMQTMVEEKSSSQRPKK